jgi:hypothetical protein
MHLPRQLCTLIACAFVIGTRCVPVDAAPIQPFEAIVQATPGEDVYARSGPGKERFYPTLKLANGQAVTVRRKDPGGWFMIDPPEGSFSWIPGKYVKSSGAQGTVTENAVVVRVGAFNSKQRDVEQVRLNRGDLVEILSEETIETERGGKTVHEQWYRIKPPPGEYRWVKGSSLAELNQDGSMKDVVPSPGETEKRKSAGGLGNENEKSGTKSRGGKGDGDTSALPVPSDENDAPSFQRAPFVQPGPQDEDLDLGPDADLGTLARTLDRNTILRELQSIRQKMQEIRQLPEIQWDLSGIEIELTALQQAAQGTSMMPLVEQRMRELRRDQLIHQNAIDFANRGLRTPAYTQRIPNQSLDSNRGPVDPRSGVYGMSPPGVPNTGGGGNVDLSRTAPNPGRSRFQGAGIVARVRNPVSGVPRYALITPQGQLLSYLEPQSGLNLEPYVGKAMGINGPRGFDERLRADRMQVQRLTPVQLAQ